MDAPTPADSPFTPTENRTLWASVLASAMAILDGSALNIALPVLQTSLGATAEQLLWVLNGYLLPLAALILLGGSLGDHYGRRRVFAWGIGGFTVASVLCGLAPSLPMLLGARVLQGVAGALMVPGSLAVLTATVDPSRRGRAIGTWSAALSAAVVAGPTLGGLLADLGWWRGVFLINLPIGAATCWLVWRHVPESYDAHLRGRRVDVPGTVLASVALGGLTFGLMRFGAPAPGWQAWLPLLGGLACAVAFVLVERRVALPLVPLAWFGNRTFAGANLLSLFLYGALSVVVTFLGLNWVQVQGYTPGQAGLAMLAFPVPLIFLSRMVGRWTDRAGFRPPLIIGPALVAVALVGLALVGPTDGPGDYWHTFLPALVCFGIGMAITVVPLTNAVMSSVPAEGVGTASGINNAVTRTAGVLAVAALGGWMIQYFVRELLAAPALADLPAAMRADLAAAAHDLGGMQLRPAWVAASGGELPGLVRTHFLAAYRWLMLACASLSALAAGMAAVTVRR